MQAKTKKLGWETPLRFLARIRPHLAVESPPKQSLAVREQQVSLDSVQTQLDGVLDGTTHQEAVFQQARPLVNAFLRGENCNVLVYGASESGKTHTVLGTTFKKYLNLDANYMEIEELKKSLATQRTLKTLRLKKKKSVVCCNEPLKKTPSRVRDVPQLEEAPSINAETRLTLEEMVKDREVGLVPRLVKAVFDQIKRKKLDVTVTCSFMQLVHENVIDLLPLASVTSKEQMRTNNIIPDSLKVREDLARANTSPFQQRTQTTEVDGLIRFKVNDEWQCLDLLRQGERNRLTRMKKLNQQGQRSTSLFQLQIQFERFGTLQRAKFSFCDLASSNAVTIKEQMETKHLVDIKKLDLSVRTLERTITAICQSQKTQTRQPLPFRESMLTRILGDCLTSKTLFIATLSPFEAHKHETTATIQFLDRARNGSCVPAEPNKSYKFGASVSKIEASSARTVEEFGERPLKVAEMNVLTKQSQANEARIEQMTKEIEDIKARQLKPTALSAALEIVSFERKKLVEENKSIAKQIESCLQQQRLNAQMQSEQARNGSSAVITVDPTCKRGQEVTDGTEGRKLLRQSQSMTKVGQKEVLEGQVSGTVNKTGGLTSAKKARQRPDSTTEQGQKLGDLTPQPLRLPAKQSLDQKQSRESDLQKHRMRLRLTLEQGSKDLVDGASNEHEQPQAPPCVTRGENKSQRPEQAQETIESEVRRVQKVSLTSVPGSRKRSDIPGDKTMHQTELVAKHKVIKQDKATSDLTTQAKATEKRTFPPGHVKQVAVQVQRLVEGFISSMMTKMDFRIAVHRNKLTNAAIAKWKPRKIKLEDSKPIFAGEMKACDTPTKPVRVYEGSDDEFERDIVSPLPDQKQSSNLGRVGRLRGQPREGHRVGLLFRSEEKELGIYTDVNSTQLDIDQSGCFEALGGASGKMGSGLNESRFTINNPAQKINFDHMKHVEQSIETSSRLTSPDSDKQLLIGEKGMCIGDRQRLSTGHSHDRPDQAVSANRGRRRVKKVPVARWVEVKKEPRPIQKAHDWLTYGNSIGNGMLISLGPIDAAEAKLNKIMRKRKDAQALQSAKREREKAYEKAKERAREKAREKARTKAQAEAIAQEVSAKKQLQVDSTEPEAPEQQMKKPSPKRGTIEFSGLAPSQWSGQKERPKSPIEYDFRGRRVTPQKSPTVKKRFDASSSGYSWSPSPNVFSLQSKGKIAVRTLIGHF